jgi:hypothetical protein
VQDGQGANVVLRRDQRSQPKGSEEETLHEALYDYCSAESYFPSSR